MSILLENGEITELEYAVQGFAVVRVCQVCRKIFDTHQAMRQHNIQSHQIGLGGGADVQL